MVVSINKVSSTVSNVVQKGKSVASSEVVLRTIAPQDKYFARTYLHAKTLDFKTTPEEINALFKFDGDEFFAKAYDFLCNKLAIPEKLKPKVIEVPQHETVGMAYDYINNVIIKNPQNGTLKTKASIFGAIRHELQHFYQNINIFRTEKVGDEAVDVYSRIAAKQRQKYLDFEVKNQTIEQLTVNYDEQTIEYYKHLKGLLKDDPKAYETELKGFEQIIFDSVRPQIQGFKELVIKEMGGQIKVDTKLAKRSEKMLKEFQNDYWKADGSVHAGKYNFDVRENDAFIAGQMAELKALPQGEKFCYIKNMREKCEEVIKNMRQNADNKELTEIAETVQNKVKQNNINSEKEYFDTMISYFYD